MKSQKSQGFMIIIVIMIMLATTSMACRFSRQPEPTTTPRPTETAPIIPTEVLVTPSETPVPTTTETVVEPEEIVLEEEIEPKPEETTSIQLGPEIKIDEIIQVGQATEPTVYQVGDVLSASNQIFMVLGWEILPEDDFFKPDPGSIFVAVDMIVVNTNPEPILISSLLQTDLTTLDDTESQDYSFSIWAQVSIKSRMIDGYVLPGERLRAKIGFEVPENATGMVFGYVPEFFFSEQVSIALDTAPGLLSPPAFIPGEVAQPAFSAEERIEIDGLALIINNVYEESGRQFYEPSEGYQYIIVDLSLTNNSGSTITLSSDQFLLKDKTGLRYQMDVSATSLGGGSLPDGEYQPGETIQIILGYEIPAYETSPQLVFDATDWDLGKIFIDLVLE